MTEQEGEDYLVTRTIKAFEYENTRSNFKCCNYWENEKHYVNICPTYAGQIIPGTQESFLDKLPQILIVYWWTSSSMWHSSCNK